MVSRLPLALVLTPLALAAFLAGCAAPGPGSSAATGDTSTDSSSYTPMSSSDMPSDTVNDCDAQPVQSMLGQSYSDSVGQSVRQRSGSHAIRLLKPGEVMTMEYNPTRINIILDDKGAIAALRCG